MIRSSRVCMHLAMKGRLSTTAFLAMARNLSPRIWQRRVFSDLESPQLKNISSRLMLGLLRRAMRMPLNGDILAEITTSSVARITSCLSWRKNSK